MLLQDKFLYVGGHPEPRFQILVGEYGNEPDVTRVLMDTDCLQALYNSRREYRRRAMDSSLIPPAAAAPAHPAPTS